MTSVPFLRSMLRRDGRRYNLDMWSFFGGRNLGLQNGNTVEKSNRMAKLNISKT
jgi:hypothetical protein